MSLPLSRAFLLLELNDFISSLTRPVAATLASAAGKDPFSPSDVSQMVPRAEALLDSVAWDPKVKKTHNITIMCQK